MKAGTKSTTRLKQRRSDHRTTDRTWTAYTRGSLFTFSEPEALEESEGPVSIQMATFMCCAYFFFFRTAGYTSLKVGYCPFLYSGKENTGNKGSRRKKIRGLVSVKCAVTLTEKSICQYSSMGQDYAVTNLHGIASLPQGVAEV